jgi:hypothetical protein
MPCTPFKINLRSGGTCRARLQDRKISQARNQRETMWKAEPQILQNVATVHHVNKMFSTRKTSPTHAIAIAPYQPTYGHITSQAYEMLCLILCNVYTR